MATIYVGQKPAPSDLRLEPGKNLYLGSSAASSVFGKLTTLEQDLLTIAGSAYATDLAFKREALTNAIRTLDLTIEVTNFGALKPHVRQIERCLHFLSNDNWNLTLSAKSGTPEPTQDWPKAKGAVLLFSGGLDSFAGSALLSEDDRNLILVSHITHNQVTARSQIELYGRLRGLGRKFIEHLPVRVYGRTHKDAPFPLDNEREDSQRTRSYLFLTLGALVARRKGIHNLLTMAENGQFAIHLPLNPARIGPFSTHTAHPEFLKMAETLFRDVLGMPNLVIQNPFVYHTKGEVVQTLPLGLRDAIPTAVSCWRSSRLATQHHCGECVPCICRRIAVESNGLKFKEYERDLFQEKSLDLDHVDNGKRNLADLGEFIGHFSGRLSKNDAELSEAYPELFNSHFDRKKVIDMYSRFAKEASVVLGRYKNTSWVLQ